jgi:hypothetical protein
MGDERWQVTGSAAEVYERQLVPAIFGPWAPGSSTSPPRGPASAS